MRTDVIYGLAVDLVAITILAHLIYFYRHYRRDLRLAYVSVNAGVFTVVTLLLVQRADLAIGFGLFGVLSIIRLRSSALTQEEVGYYFVSLALGLVNGLAAQAPWVALPLDAVLLGVMYVADHPRFPPRTVQRVVTLDVVHPHEGALRADLENRLGGTLLRHSVIEVDYVRDITVVDVRFLPRAPRRETVRVPATRASAPEDSLPGSTS
ncbi:DUF4956 domain-containing protein [Actinomadura madurae]|uniref:DUF4956 domain-containing protein n=1 Tax=Actinomadura madurae TaxID=1993 RepID=UPI0020D20AFC|nr:DUF4956 domain-containing protein [Actinomadura madurae]MCP9955238.1 DUF4956 domain-containing protein [Actinomadura madurae]MCQ0020671.1 DUF4956 domain-containing protein [Actinomadura madurae]